MPAKEVEGYQAEVNQAEAADGDLSAAIRERPPLASRDSPSPLAHQPAARVSSATIARQATRGRSISRTATPAETRTSGTQPRIACAHSPARDLSQTRDRLPRAQTTSRIAALQIAASRVT